MVSTWVVVTGQPGLAGSSGIQLGKHDDRKCEKLAAGRLPYARAEAFTRHLAEYCFRFNHRFDLKSMLVELGHAVVASPPMPYRLLKLAGHG